MWPLEIHAQVKREQIRDYLAAQAEDRLARSLLLAQRGHHAERPRLRQRLAGRIAAPLGRAVLHLGLGFVRVGAALEGYGTARRPMPAVDHIADFGPNGPWCT